MGAHGDPAADDRAGYDYVGGAVERPGLVAALRDRVDGDVRFDEYTRQLYATDASIYEVTPIGVVFPRSVDDVAAVATYCSSEGIPILPRGSGTSLAGQAVNEAVVLDFTRYMDGLEAIDPDARVATVQPGLRLGDLNATLEPHDLHFGPDPAWGDQSAIGGAIGNNSSGSHSLVYGTTDAYIETCQVVFADGTVDQLGEVPRDELTELAAGDGPKAALAAEAERLIDQSAKTIADAYPNIGRNVSGYNLDRLVAEAADGRVNLARLLAGSEGTLAIITEATVSLEPRPPTKAMALLEYDDLLDAMADVAPIVDHGPAAVEVMDGVLLDLARDTEEFGALVESMLRSETDAVLLVEFYADTDADGRQQVADLLADRLPTATTQAVPAETAGKTTEAPVRAARASEAHDEADRGRFWKLRKSGLPILLGRTSEEKHISFIEDAAVPPTELKDFVADFQAVLEAEDTSASFYGHAGPGCLHVRPLINAKTIRGVEQMEAIAEAVTDLVVEYGGSVSGEHGDGRARTQWNEKLYGSDVMAMFRDLKDAVDPDWLLNPGQVCGDVGMTDHMRFSLDYDLELGFEPALEWPNDNGMQGMVELCHGCGGCRGPQHTSGGVMCPTYRAADEEITSTRGRANMLRQAMSGDLPEDPTSDEFATEVMDLCIGCKGCAKDCPSEVDMAKLKAEIAHERHQREGASLRDRLFANIHTVTGWGSRLAPVSNWFAGLPGSDRLAESLLGIAAERETPSFASTSFESWFREHHHGPAPNADTSGRRALLVPDPYTNYVEPEIGKAAVQVLEAAAVHVDVPAGLTASGRAAFSKGFLDLARERVETNVGVLAPLVADGCDVVVLEPSDTVLYQSDALDLGAAGPVDRVAHNSYGFAEYLDVFDLVEQLDTTPTRSLTYHGHCHQTAIGRDHHAVAALRRAGFEVDALDSGCCGMAGSFGYEAEHYSMSQAIGSILFEQVDESPGEVAVAPGASCRTQLRDRRNGKPAEHPARVFAEAITQA